MTFEHFWQWIFFLIWFKLVHGSSRHTWLCSKSWRLPRSAKGFMKKAENTHKKQRHRWWRREERPICDLKEREGEASELWAPVRAAQLLRAPADWAVGSPSWDLEVTTESVVVLPGALRASPSYVGAPTKLATCKTDGAWIEQQIHWIK